MPQKVKAQHALNWFYGNICTRKCYNDLDKERRCYQGMQEIIAGHEDFMITRRDFIRVMRVEHEVCALDEKTLRKRERDFWTRKL